MTKNVTLKQKHAVRLIVETLRIPFKGDIENRVDVSNFLHNHLVDAKLLKKQLDEVQTWREKVEYEEYAVMEGLGGPDGW